MSGVVASCCEPGPLRIEQARTADDLEALFQFRYRVSVLEMRREESHADHGAGRIQDGLDDHAINLIAWCRHQVVGCLRVNLGAHGDFAYYADFYEIGPQSSYPHERTGIVTRLMIAPEFRRSRLAAGMCAAAFETGLRHGVRWCFVDCQPDLVRFFTGLGCVEYASPKTHKDYGESHRMRLDLEDCGHLRRIRSPFCRVLSRLASPAPSDA